MLHNRNELLSSLSSSREAGNRTRSACPKSSLVGMQNGKFRVYGISHLRPGKVEVFGQPVLRAEEILLIFSAPCYAAVRFSLSTTRKSFWRRSTAVLCQHSDERLPNNRFRVKGTVGAQRLHETDIDLALAQSLNLFKPA
jgi:hypothetical protein